MGVMCYSWLAFYPTWRRPCRGCLYVAEDVLSRTFPSFVNVVVVREYYGLLLKYISLKFSLKRG